MEKKMKTFFFAVAMQSFMLLSFHLHILNSTSSDLLSLGGLKEFHMEFPTALIMWKNILLYRR